MRSTAFPLLSLACLMTLMLPAAHADVQVAAGVTFSSQAKNNKLLASQVDHLNVTYSDDRGAFRLLHQTELDIGSRFITERGTRVTKYQTIEAISSNGNTQIFLNTDSSTLKIQQALVVQPDGETRVVDPNTIQIVDDQEDNVFSNHQYVVIPWPGLKPGSVVFLKYERTQDTTKSVMPWSRTTYPQGGNYTHRYEYNAHWQNAALVPNWHSSDPMVACNTDAKNSLNCTADEIPPYETDESVNYYDSLPQIAIAAKTEWKELADTVKGFVDKSMSGSADVIAKAREVTKTMETDRERLSAIHEFVARDIRYVGLEHGNSSHVPRPSQTTLSRRYGDCKDMTTLLLDMLRAVDIDAYPVLVSTIRSDPTKLAVPAAGAFNHLIACGEFSDGESFCLDPTDSYTPASSISSSNQGAVALKLRSKDVVAPEVLAQDTYRWTLNEKLKMSILADGKLTESLELAYSGPYGSFIRSTLAGFQQEERVEWAQETYAEVVTDSVTPEFEIEGVDELTNVVSLVSNITYDNLIPLDTNLKYVENAPWLDRLIGYFISENEHYGYSFPGMRYESLIEVDVDSKWTLDRASADLNFESKFGSLTRTHTIDGDTVTFITKVQLPQRRISLEELSAFNFFLNVLKSQNHFKIYGNLQTS